MKLLSPLFLKEVSKTEINRLTKETKETLDIILENDKKKKFTGADLWNIHRQRRSFSTRRYI